MSFNQKVMICGGGAMAAHSMASLMRYDHLVLPELLGIFIGLWLIVRLEGV